jgi:hypothetical protein
LKAAEQKLSNINKSSTTEKETVQPQKPSQSLHDIGISFSSIQTFPDLNLFLNCVILLSPEEKFYEFRREILSKIRAIEDDIYEIKHKLKL